MALDSLFVETPSFAPSAASVGIPARSVASVPPLPALNALRAELARLHGHIIRLRCGDPPKGTRPAALTYVDQQITRLADDSVQAGGTEDGWHDPEELLVSGDQIRGLREELAELAAPDNSYPLALPDGAELLPRPNFDLLGSGRLGNGKVSQGGEVSPSQLRGNFQR